MFNNLTSLRFWIIPMLLAGVASVILVQPIAYFASREAAEAAVPYILIPLLLIIGVFMAMPRNGGYHHCPKCGKGLRKSKGATTCHHCGFDTLIAVGEERDRHAAKQAAPAQAKAQTVQAARQALPPVAVASPSMPSTGLANPSQTLELAMPAEVAWERVQTAMNKIGKTKQAANTSRMLVGEARYGLQAVKIKVAVVSGTKVGTSVLEIEGAGDDVWGVGERKVTERFMLALG